MSHEKKKAQQYNIVILIVVSVISILGLYFRFKMFNERVLWVDELDQFRLFVKFPFLEVIEKARGQFQFPGNFILLYPFFKTFGADQKWGVALPYIGSTLLGLYFLYMLCRQYFKTIAGYIVTFLIVAFNYNLIWHAFEIRPYSVLVTLSIAVFLVMKYIIANPTLARSKKYLVNLFIVLSVIYHFYGMFMLFFAYLYHLIFSREKRSFSEVLSKNVKDYWPAILILLPFLYYFVIKPERAYMDWDTFRFINKGFIPITKGILGNLMGYPRFYFLMAGFGICLFIPNQDKFKQVAMLAITIACPILLILWSCVANRYWFVPRLFVWVIPWFAFLLGWCWDSIFTYLQNLMFRLDIQE